MGGGKGGSTSAGAALRHDGEVVEWKSAGQWTRSTPIEFAIKRGKKNFKRSTEIKRSNVHKENYGRLVFVMRERQPTIC